MSTKNRLNILVLHRMGDPRQWRTAVRDLEFMLPTYAPENNYIVHDMEMPLPGFVKEIKFHGIVLGPTCLCARYHQPGLARVLKEYDFIRTSDAFKIALPQDEYDCSAILDRWLVNWDVDLVYSVIPENWHVLYPTYSMKSRILLGYTGYVSDSWIHAWRDPKAFKLRNIDVSYRANKLQPNFGRLGYIKGIIGDLFISSVGNSGLSLDISTNPKDFIAGDKWHSFVEDSKFCLATNSGSSLLDPDGLIRARVQSYLAKNPSASFEEVDEKCFKGEDGKYMFTALSPRNIEAALAKTVQIATPGSYSGILEEGLHYISLQPDCSNISDVLSIMKDRRKVADIAAMCKEAVLSVKELRASNHVGNMIQQFENGVTAKKTIGTGDEKAKQALARYKNEIEYEKFWKHRRLLNNVRTIAAKYGARKIKNFLSKSNLGKRCY